MGKNRALGLVVSMECLVMGLWDGLGVDGVEVSKSGLITSAAWGDMVMQYVEAVDGIRYYVDVRELPDGRTEFINKVHARLLASESNEQWYPTRDIVGNVVGPLSEIQNMMRRSLSGTYGKVDKEVPFVTEENLAKIRQREENWKRVESEHKLYTDEYMAWLNRKCDDCGKANKLCECVPFP